MDYRDSSPDPCSTTTKTLFAFHVKRVPETRQHTMPPSSSGPRTRAASFRGLATIVLLLPFSGLLLWAISEPNNRQSESAEMPDLEGHWVGNNWREKQKQNEEFAIREPLKVVDVDVPKTEPSRPPAVLDLPRKFVPATHPHLQYWGRWFLSSPVAAENDYVLGTEAQVAGKGYAGTGWKNPAVVFRVSGTTSVSLHVVVPHKKTPIYVWTHVDDNPEWTMTTLLNGSAILVSGLDPTSEHSLELRFDYEHNFLSVRAIGLDPAQTAKLVTHVDLRTRLEFVGDSISSMMANDASTTPLRPASFPIEACRILHIKCAVVAKHGLGIRNLPNFYLKVAVGGSSPSDWDPKVGPVGSFGTPKAAVINLGTNDRVWYTTNASDFEHLYVKFGNKIRQTHGASTTLVLIQPFGYFPNGRHSPIIPDSTMNSIAEKIGGSTHVILTASWMNTKEHPELFQRYYMDVAHPSPAGQLYFGGKVAETIKQLNIL